MLRISTMNLKYPPSYKPTIIERVSDFVDENGGTFFIALITFVIFGIAIAFIKVKVAHDKRIEEHNGIRATAIATAEKPKEDMMQIVEGLKGAPPKEEINPYYSLYVLWMEKNKDKYDFTYNEWKELRALGRLPNQETKLD